jgi:hypothetical protein
MYIALKGEDDVCMCKVNGNNLDVQHYYNQGKSPELMDSNNTKLGFTNSNISLNNGLLICTVARKKSLLGNAKYLDISNTAYYILFALGTLDTQSKLLKNKDFEFFFLLNIEFHVI